MKKWIVFSLIFLAASITWIYFTIEKKERVIFVQSRVLGDDYIWSYVINLDIQDRKFTFWDHQWWEVLGGGKKLLTSEAHQKLKEFYNKLHYLVKMEKTDLQPSSMNCVLKVLVTLGNNQQKQLCIGEKVQYQEGLYLIIDEQVFIAEYTKPGTYWDPPGTPIGQGKYLQLTTLSL